ncbi:MAG: hypothetical protein ACRC3B_00420, partial [Bacteroidia bacterium]
NALLKRVFFLFHQSLSLTTFTLLFVCSCYQSSAQGDLLVAPKRIVFQNNSRYQELNIVNTGKDTMRYSIYMINYRMKEDGSLTELTAADPQIRFSDSFVRFFPRSVVLAPRESQVVRLQLTKTNQLQEGEYRSHLYFRSIPGNQQLTEEQKPAKKDSSAISIRLKPVFGIAVPVIIRSGTSTTKTGISNCQLLQSPTPSVKLTLTRSGNMSCYGDITVDHISTTGSSTRVAELKGVAVYIPIEARHLSIRLNQSTDYTRGKLVLTYKVSGSTQPEEMTQAELILK